MLTNYLLLLAGLVLIIQLFYCPVKIYSKYIVFWIVYSFISIFLILNHIFTVKEDIIWIYSDFICILVHGTCIYLQIRNYENLKKLKYEK